MQVFVEQQPSQNKTNYKYKLFPKWPRPPLPPPSKNEVLYKKKSKNIQQFIFGFPVFILFVVLKSDP